jgi:hypothetical protein
MDKNRRGSRRERNIGDAAPSMIFRRGTNEKEILLSNIFRCRAVLGDASMPR